MRTGGVRVVCGRCGWSPIGRHFTLSTMKGKASVITFVIRAAGFVGETFLNVFPPLGASERNAVGNESKAKRLGPTLLLALPFLVALIPEAVDSTRTINVTVSRHGLSPERIEFHVGERIRLNVLSLDGTPGFQVKGLGLNAAIPSGARSVTVELTPKEVGTFAINCSEYCGRDHRSMQASLIVTPRR
jgi:heme/copper-type cytochrome/quinol oxidase subunit 2